jgi:hypothetical protein
VVFCGDLIQHVENPLGLLRVLHHVCRETLYLTTDVKQHMSHECKAHCVAVPFLWDEQFVIDMMRVAEWREPREIGRYSLDSEAYGSRTVTLIGAQADSSFSLETLQRNCRTQVGDYLHKGLR